jgi:hypothetical protein
MRRSRFGEEQIIAILREEAGSATSEVCRRHRSQTRPSTSIDGSPMARRFGFCCDENRLQHLSGVAALVARPNGESAHTLLNKWSASRSRKIGGGVIDQDTN